MVSTKRVLPIILAFEFLLPKAFVSGSKESCPAGAVLNITGSNKDSLGYSYLSNIEFPPKSTWFENGEEFGCPCDTVPCLQLCCPLGFTTNGNGCEMDDYTSHIIDRGYEDYGEDYHIFTEDPCHLSTTDRAVLDGYFELKEDGSIYLAESELEVPLGKYCLLRVTNSNSYWAGGCTYLEWTGLMIWFVFCISISVFFALITFYVCTVSPELKTLRGTILRCYSAAYVGCTILSATGILSERKLSLPSHSYSKINTIFGSCFLGFACMLWLEVLSFDIWREIRIGKFQCHPDVDRKREKKKLVCYSIYAWGGSAIYAIIFSLTRLIWMWFVSSAERFYIYFGVLPIFGIAICTAYFHILTALMMRKWQKEAEDVIHDSNERDKGTKKWFYMTVKFFSVTGLLLILCIIAFYWKNNGYLMFICAIQSLQGIFTFVIFVWNDEIKRLFRYQFYEMLRTIRSFFQRFHI